MILTVSVGAAPTNCETQRHGEEAEDDQIYGVFLVIDVQGPQHYMD